jgi:hypothetical protein
MDPDKNGNKVDLFSILRFGTPILVTVSLFLSTLLMNKIDKMDEKLFCHLTNDEIHAPRSQYVSQTEFDVYQKMREKQLATTEAMISDIHRMISDLQKTIQRGR